MAVSRSVLEIKLFCEDNMKIGKELLDPQLSNHIQDKKIGMGPKFTARQSLLLAALLQLT